MAADAAEDEPPRRIGDRPLLYPYNRRLRHLTGISLRNLCTNPPSPSPSRPSTPTCASPAADAASSSSPSPAAARSDARDEAPDALPAAAAEPAAYRRKRANTTLSTMTCTAPHRRPNVFFSLHIPGEETPVYISEVMESTMNPDFLWFELDRLGPRVTRLGECTVRVFVQEEADGEREGSWVWLLEEKVELPALSFLGKTLESWSRPLPENCVIYWLADGAYAAVPSAPTPDPPLPRPPTTTTATFDALHTLRNLTTCIADAVATTHHLTTTLNTLLLTTTPARTLTSTLSTTRTRLATLHTALTTARRRLHTSQRRRTHLHETNTHLRATLAASHTDLAARHTHLSASTSILTRAHTALSSTREALHHIRHSHLHTLASIFPITFTAPFYTILGHRIPRADAATPDADEAAAALGFVAHYLHILSFYLAVPLRYPVHPCGSRSAVRDTVSVIQGARSFPLWIKGAAVYRFEYALFLVSKDVEQLLGAAGVRVVEVGEVGGNLLGLVMCFEGSEKWRGRRAGEQARAGRAGSVARVVRRGADGRMRIEERAGSRAGSPRGARVLELLRVPDG